MHATLRNYFIAMSDHMCRFQPTGLVASFDLDSRMGDPKTQIELLAHLIKKLVSRRAARHDPAVVP